MATSVFRGASWCFRAQRRAHQCPPLLVTCCAFVLRAAFLLPAEVSSSTAEASTSVAPAPQPTLEDLERVGKFCSCDVNQVYWPNYVHHMGYHCWRTFRKVAAFHFVDAQQLFLEHFRGDNFHDVAETCPVGTLNLATIVGSIYEAHDLGERNYLDLENWMSMWQRWAAPVTDYADSRNVTSVDCRQVADELSRWRIDANYDDASHLGSVFSSDHGGTNVENGVADEDEAASSRRSREVGVAVKQEQRSNDHGAEDPSRAEDYTDSILPWVFDIPRFRQMIDRMYRKLSAWQRLLWEDQEDSPTAREAALFSRFVETITQNRIREALAGVGGATTRTSSAEINQLGEEQAAAPTTEEGSFMAEQESSTTGNADGTAVAATTVVEDMEAPKTSMEQLREGMSLGICLVYGNGARTFEHSLRTYKELGLLELAQERYVSFLEDVEPVVEPRNTDEVEEGRSEGEDNANADSTSPQDLQQEAAGGTEEENKGSSEEANSSTPAKSPSEAAWRARILEEFSLTEIRFDDYPYPDTFIKISKTSYMRTGKAFSSCAMRARTELVLFLEDDWEIISRPHHLVVYRLFDAARLLLQKKADMVHLRHKLFYGPPYYELLTAVQHNEPPPVSLALYFSEDPVSSGSSSFPDSYWSPPFLEHPFCDNNRTSWLRALKHQSFGDFGERGEGEDHSPLPAVEGPTKSHLYWCDDELSANVCHSTLAAKDPFRNLFYTTNPTLYRRKDWIRFFSPTVAILGDARAIEESITVSYQWRENPGFTVAFSPGLFRHKRVDRAKWL